MPFQTYTEQWRSIQVHRPTTAAQIETYLRLHAYSMLGGRPLGAIRRSDIQSWVKDLTRVLAPASVELVYRWGPRPSRPPGATGSSPGVGITLPKRNDGEVVCSPCTRSMRWPPLYPTGTGPSSCSLPAWGLRQGSASA